MVARIPTAVLATARVAARRACNSRRLKAGRVAAGRVANVLGRLLHTLFLQITGLFFCLFALGLAVRIPAAIHEQAVLPWGTARVYLLTSLSLLFAWFGISSFWRTRRKRRDES